MTGSDSRLRLWDVESGCDTLVNFETVRLQTSKPIQLATTQDSTVVFVPCMRVVKVSGSFSLLQFLTLKLAVVKKKPLKLAAQIQKILFF